MLKQIIIIGILFGVFINTALGKSSKAEYNFPDYSEFCSSDGKLVANNPISKSRGLASCFNGKLMDNCSMATASFGVGIGMTAGSLKALDEEFAHMASINQYPFNESAIVEEAKQRHTKMRTQAKSKVDPERVKEYNRKLKNLKYHLNKGGTTDVVQDLKSKLNHLPFQYKDVMATMPYDELPTEIKYDLEASLKKEKMIANPDLIKDYDKLIKNKPKNPFTKVFKYSAIGGVAGMAVGTAIEILSVPKVACGIRDEKYMNLKSGINQNCKPVYEFDGRTLDFLALPEEKICKALKENRQLRKYYDQFAKHYFERLTWEDVSCSKSKISVKVRDQKDSTPYVYTIRLTDNQNVQQMDVYNTENIETAKSETLTHRIRLSSSDQKVMSFHSRSNAGGMMKTVLADDISKQRSSNFTHAQFHSTQMKMVTPALKSCCKTAGKADYCKKLGFAKAHKQGPSETESKSGTR